MEGVPQKRAVGMHLCRTSSVLSSPVLQPLQGPSLVISAVFQTRGRGKLTKGMMVAQGHTDNENQSEEVTFC